MVSGHLRKLDSSIDASGAVNYQFTTDKAQFPINHLIGKTFKLDFLGSIQCVHCHKKIKKSYSQGYCYPCTLTLPQTDLCQVKPETCHFSNNTCRDPEWAKKLCFIKHTVYLSLTSGLKVGITRSYQQKKRWVDQGALQAIPLCYTQNRKAAGEIEQSIAQSISDKTNWRKMLSNTISPVDLVQSKAKLTQIIPKSAVFEPASDSPLDIKYPVIEYPVKVTSLNVTKTPTIEDQLMGIKGQYLIFKNGVLNIRKYSGYSISSPSFS